MRTTFKLPLELLLLANVRYLRHAPAERDFDKVERYAAMSAETAPAIRVRKDSTVADGMHRLMAAKIRGDKEVLCSAATPQEECSFH